MSSEVSPPAKVFTVTPFCLDKTILIDARRRTLLAPQAHHPEAAAQGIHHSLNRHPRPLILLRNQYTWLPDVLRLKNSVTYPR